MKKSSGCRRYGRREKQFERILTNAVGFYGSLRGIAGTSIPQIKMLEGGESEE